MVIKVDNALKISWDPPFTLKDIDFYNLYIRGISPAESYQKIVVQETHYILDESDFMENRKYIFQVSAQNFVGEGNMSDPEEFDG